VSKTGETREAARDFDAFYAASAGRVVHTLYAMTGNRAEAQDCVQEAYERAWQRWGTVRGYADPEAWVRTVARRIAVSRWRKTRNAVTAWRRHGPPPDASPPGVEHVLLVRALRELPDAQRHALVLHYLAGLSVEEVAVETGAPAGTVKARLHRGRAALALLLASEPDRLSEGETDSAAPYRARTETLDSEVRRAR
jgi:RNA polymerase sigma-70 factor (ECF subfamily)